MNWKWNCIRGRGFFAGALTCPLWSYFDLHQNFPGKRLALRYNYSYSTHIVRIREWTFSRNDKVTFNANAGVRVNAVLQTMEAMMSEGHGAAAETTAVRYRNNFLAEVEAHVEDGQWVKMCMQCGVCAGSCPLGQHWQHTPQKLFQMIRAGKREEVLTSDAMWMCTSCYNCVVRCPRKLPITQIMHGLASYAHKLGLAPKMQPTRDFSILFWNNCTRTGRVNELKLTMGLYFSNGLIAGIKKGWSMRNIALGLVMAKRLNPFELFGGHQCKDQKGIAAMLKKAREIENERKRAAS